MTNKKEKKSLIMGLYEEFNGTSQKSTVENIQNQLRLYTEIKEMKIQKHSTQQKITQ